MKKLSAKQKNLLESILQVVWVITIVIGAQFVVLYPLLWMFGRGFLLSPAGQTITTAVFYLVALLIIVLIPWKIFKKWRTNRDELGISKLPTWTDIGLAPIAFAASVLAAMPLTALFSLFPWFDANEAQNVGFNTINSGWDRILAFFSLVIVAPIAEEIIFRGWLYGKLRAKMSMIPAMIIVSMAFGFVHLQWNIGVNVFALSLVLCGLREITGTTHAGILTHMIKNGLAFFLLFVV